MTPKYIYFHICTLGSYLEIITRLMTKIQSSRLLDEVDEVRYVIVGAQPENAHHIMRRYPKTRCLHTDPNTALYERATLHRLRDDCQAMTQPAHIMYLHSKGVSRPAVYLAAIERWVGAMMDGLTSYRHLCWRALEEGHHAVGSLARAGCRGMQGEPLPVHFSGNFWWARSSHIATLPLIGPGYLDPEMWVLGDGRHASFVCIDDLVARTPNFFALNFPPVERYRGTIVFKNLASKNNTVVKHGDVVSLEIGIDNHWVPGTVPVPGSRVALSMTTMNVTTNPEHGSVKMVRLHRVDGTTLYFLENEVVHFLA